MTYWTQDPLPGMEMFPGEECPWHDQIVAETGECRCLVMMKRRMEGEDVW